MVKSTDIWIGETFDTETKPLKFISSPIRQPFTCVPDGIYTPTQLGLRFPLCQEIRIAHCQDNIHAKAPYSLGHIHDHDPIICFRNGSYVYESEGVPDQVALHEYAHIIAGYEEDHGSRWVKIARDLGVVDPSPFNPYIYQGEPRVAWESLF